MYRFSASVLHDYCRDVLVAAGVDGDCALTVADMLIDAELSGISTHGVSRMSIYMQRMEKGLMSKTNNIRVIKESPSAVVIDAGNTLGAAAAKFAMELCIRKAREAGCCFASVRGSNHFGTAGYYTKMASAHDMIGFACTNLTGKIAPHGSADPFMGTNPIAVCAPSHNAPFLLDMTPTVAALGKLILAQKLGQEIPIGWALDKDGKPTADPAEGRKGSLVPIGGAKGSGMAMAVDILSGILSGAGYGPHLHDLYAFDAPQGIGHFMGAIDISHFIEVEAFKAMMDTYADEIHGLRKADGFSEITVPGERSLRKAEENSVKGIDLPDAVYQELSALGKPYGLTLKYQYI